MLCWTHTPGAGAPLAKTSVPVKQVWPAGTCVGHVPPLPGVPTVPNPSPPPPQPQPQPQPQPSPQNGDLSYAAPADANPAAQKPYGYTGPTGRVFLGGVPEAAGVCVGADDGDAEGDGLGLGLAVGAAVGATVAGGVVAVGVAGAAVSAAALGEPLATAVAIDAGATGDEDADADADTNADWTGAVAPLADGRTEPPVCALARGRCTVGTDAQAVARKAATSVSAIRRNRMTLPPTRDYPRKSRAACPRRLLGNRRVDGDGTADHDAEPLDLDDTADEESHIPRQAGGSAVE